jgi:hypothetical protein
MFLQLLEFGWFRDAEAEVEGEEEEANGKGMCQAPTHVFFVEVEDAASIVGIGRGGGVFV